LVALLPKGPATQFLLTPAKRHAGESRRLVSLWSSTCFRINPAFAQLLLRHQTDTGATTGRSIDVQLIDIMRFARMVSCASTTSRRHAGDDAAARRGS